MADPHRSANADTTDHAAAEEGPPAGPPQWVKVFGIVALVVLVLLVTLLIVGGGGGHGPGRHTGGRATFAIAITEAPRVVGDASTVDSSLIPAPGNRRR